MQITINCSLWLQKCNCYIVIFFVFFFLLLLLYTPCCFEFEYISSTFWKKKYLQFFLLFFLIIFHSAWPKFDKMKRQIATTFKLNLCYRVAQIKVFLFQMTVPLKLFISDHTLIKPKCVSEAVVFFLIFKNLFTFWPRFHFESGS